MSTHSKEFYQFFIYVIWLLAIIFGLDEFPI